MIAEINGTIRYGEASKGLRKIHILPDMVESKSHGMQSGGEEKEYSLPRGVHINVQEGEKVKAGDPLMDGPRNPHRQRAGRKWDADVSGDGGRQHQ